MEVSRRRIRNLEPARPLRRLNMNQELQRAAEAEPLETTVEKLVDSIKVKQFYEILAQHSPSQAPVKTERISYTRDFLISFADSPIATTKPAFLPELPVILDKVRIPDVQKLSMNNDVDIESFM